MKSSKLSLLKKNELFRGITDGDFKMLMEEIHPVTKAYKKNSIIIHEGEQLELFGIVSSGTLSGEILKSSGDMHMPVLFQEGDCFGLENAATKKRRAPLTITAIRDSEIIYIDIEDIYSCSKRDILKDNLIRVLADENIKKMFKIDILSKSGLRDRIMTYLRIMQQNRGSNTFDIGMNQEQFARYLSVNRSSLSNELNEMRREGIIEFKRDRYTIYF